MSDAKDWAMTREPITVSLGFFGGVEARWHLALAEHLEKTRAGLVFVEFGLPPNGIVDILAISADTVSVIEVKAPVARPSAIPQLARYLASATAMFPGRRVQAVLAAPRLTLTVQLPEWIVYQPLVRA